MNKTNLNSMVQRRRLNFSIWAVIAFVLIAFVVGNRLQSVGDWFFSPYPNSSNKNLKSELDTAAVQEIYDTLKQNYDGQLDAAKLEDGIKKGLVEAAGDPYTVYMNEAEASEYLSDLNGNFSGIGAELGKKQDRLVVIAPLDGSPALSAGLRAGDFIISVDGESTEGKSVDEAVKKIRGEAGTKVKLGIARGSQQLNIEITRANISVPSVKSEVKDGIGYLKISRFAEDTSQLAIRAANDFKAKNVKGVIVDVRNNGGGLLDTSVDVASIWLDNKLVVEEKQGDKTVQSLRSKRTSILAGVPTVVLVNEGSASASEILAGALSDHGAATLVGEKTFGKGSVQQFIELKSGGKIKVTVARWYTPNGKNIDKEGIEPAIKVGLSVEDFNANRDSQKDAAIKELNK